MANKSNVPAVVPALGGEASLNRYLAEIRKFPLLTPEQIARLQGSAAYYVQQQQRHATQRVRLDPPQAD